MFAVTVSSFHLFKSLLVIGPVSSAGAGPPSPWRHGLLAARRSAYFSKSPQRTNASARPIELAGLPVADRVPSAVMATTW